MPSARSSKRGGSVGPRASGCVLTEEALLALRRIPHVPPGTCAQALGLTNRTRNALVRAGLAGDLSRLGGLPVERLSAVRGLGPRSLADLLGRMCAAQSPPRGASRPRKPNPGRIRALLAQIAAVPGALDIRSTDVRLGLLVLQAAPKCSSVGQLVRAWRRGTSLRVNEDALVSLRDAIRRMSRMSCEEELIEILSHGEAGRTLFRKGRRRDVVAAYYGLGRAPAKTLEAIGQRLGVTRERVRQICNPIALARTAPKPFAPAVDKALAIIRKRIPDSRIAIQNALVEQGLLRPGTHLRTVIRAARLLKRQPRLVMQESGSDHLVGDDRQRDLVVRACRMARALMVRSGFTSVADVRARWVRRVGSNLSDDLLTAMLQSERGFRWLDRSAGTFFYAEGGRNPIRERIRMIMAVAPRIRIDEVRAALERDDRCRAPVPDALIEFCRQMPGCRVRGQEVLAAPRDAHADALTSNAVAVVRLFRKHGPFLRFGELIRLALAAGLPKATVTAYMHRLPILKNHGHGLYSLVGVKSPPK